MVFCILSFILSFWIDFNFSKNFFFFKPGLVFVAALNITFCQFPPLPFSLVETLSTLIMVSLDLLHNCLHGTSLFSWVGAIVVWVPWLLLPWLTPLCYWSISSSSFLRKGVWGVNFSKILGLKMSYNLHFDSLVSYRLLERKPFSIRTLTLPYCLPAPRVTVWWQSGLSRFCAVCPHPGTSIIHSCCTFSLFSSPLLSSRPPCPDPPSCSLPPPHLLAPLSACCTHSPAEPQFWSSHPVWRSPLSDRVTSQEITSDCKPRLW